MPLTAQREVGRGLAHHVERLTVDLHGGTLLGPVGDAQLQTQALGMVQREPEVDIVEARVARLKVEADAPLAPVECRGDVLVDPQRGVVVEIDVVVEFGKRLDAGARAADEGRVGVAEGSELSGTL